MKVNVTTFGAVAGTNPLTAAMHQWSNVRNVAGTPGFEAAAASGGTVSGGPADEDITTTGNNRLAVNTVFYANALATQVTSAFAGETGGNWLINSFSPTDNFRRLMLQTADMPTAGTIGGGVVPGTWPAAPNQRIVQGWAFAPCSRNTAPFMHHYRMMTA